jgi:hypothetical protein
MHRRLNHANFNNLDNNLQDRTFGEILSDADQESCSSPRNTRFGWRTEMNRRRFIKHAAALSASARLACGAKGAPMRPPPQFKAGAISDGFSQDFEEAVRIIKSFGLQWVEIRRVFGIYNTEATSAQVRQ